MKKTKILSVGIIAYIVFLSLGCGSGGGGGNGGPQFTFTDQGYPIIAGNYALTIGKLTNNCGAQDSPPQTISNTIVTQNNESLLFSRTSDDAIKAFEAIGFTVVEESDMAGTILKDGRFSTTRGVTLRHETYGNFYLSYALNGEFTPSGFTGKLGYTALDDFGNSCYFSGDIHGEKF